MKTNLLLVMILVLLFALGPTSMEPRDVSEDTPDSSTVYYCPMHEDQRASEPGTCAVCGMALVAGIERTRVGIFVFDNMQILDFAGPYDVFATNSDEFEVFTVSEKTGPVKATNNLSVNPSFTFDNSPPIDVLVIPGGNVGAPIANPRVIRWIRESARDADYVLSVCTGAFLIAKAGLLENQTATTYASAIDQLRRLYPHTEVVDDRRYVDNGKIVVSAGISSGIDAALYLVGKLTGMGAAQQVALSLEYDWDPHSSYVRAQLADQFLPRFRPSAEMEMRLDRSEGDRDSWEVEGTITTSLTLHELATELRKSLSADGQWEFDRAVENGRATLTGHREGTNGRAWRTVLQLEDATDGGAYQMQMTLRLGG